MIDYWKETKPQIIIVCAACRSISGLVICSARHWDKIMLAQAKAIEDFNPKLSQQGFIDQFGNFYDREQAMDIVANNTQHFDIKRNEGDTTLFSEGLY